MVLLAALPVAGLYTLYFEANGLTLPSRRLTLPLTLISGALTVIAENTYSVKCDFPLSWRTFFVTFAGRDERLAELAGVVVRFFMCERPTSRMTWILPCCSMAVWVSSRFRNDESSPGFCQLDSRVYQEWVRTHLCISKVKSMRRGLPVEDWPVIGEEFLPNFSMLRAPRRPCDTGTENNLLIHADAQIELRLALELCMRMNDNLNGEAFSSLWCDVAYVRPIRCSIVSRELRLPWRLVLVVWIRLPFTLPHWDNPHFDALRYVFHGGFCEEKYEPCGQKSKRNERMSTRRQRG